MFLSLCFRSIWPGTFQIQKHILPVRNLIALHDTVTSLIVRTESLYIERGRKRYPFFLLTSLLKPSEPSESRSLEEELVSLGATATKRVPRGPFRNLAGLHCKVQVLQAAVREEESRLGDMTEVYSIRIWNTFHIGSRQARDETY